MNHFKESSPCDGPAKGGGSHVRTSMMRENFCERHIDKCSSGASRPLLRAPFYIQQYGSPFEPSQNNCLRDSDR